MSVFLLLSLLTTVRFTCRAAICTQSVRDIALRAVAEDLSLFGAFSYTVYAHSRTDFEPQRRRASGAPSFRRTQAPFASTTTSCSCSPWFFVLLFPHDKNFAFIFDMQALVRLFLSCGSPCVRSTSDCAVLLATPGAQSAVA